MSNLYGTVPKLLTWLTIDEVDLDLPCGVCVWCDELRTAVVLIVVPNSSQGTHTPQVQKITLPNTDYAHKNITSNFSQVRSTLPEDGPQRIRNMSEFLIVL